MGHVIGPGSSYSGGHSSSSRRKLTLPFARTIREYGIKGATALCAAAVLAFLPLGFLVWFNLLRFQPAVQLAKGQHIVVKPGRHEAEQAQEEAGDTALLQVVCEVPTADGWRALLRDDDPARRSGQFSDWHYVRREAVYLRPAGNASLPFGLLGKPPVSAWLPADSYEILVVHEAPHSEQRVDAYAKSFPFVSVPSVCVLEAQRKTVCRVQLPHYDWGGALPIALATDDGSPAEREPSEMELSAFTAAVENAPAFPTPGGYVLALPEPDVRHGDDHRLCAASFADLHAIPREWTREQLATLRNWLPTGATKARARLSPLVDALGWREFCAGWFCYAAAGVTGLVFTQWGATAILEPAQRRRSFGESLKLLLSIFLLSALVMLLLNILSR